MNDTEILNAALTIGKMLARDAIWDGDRCNWLGPVNDFFFGTMLSGYGTMGPALYDGTAGIALFLAELGNLTDDHVITQTAIGAMNHSVSRYQDCPASVSLSFYTGHVGIGYAAIRVGQLFDRKALIAGGVQIIRQALHSDSSGKCILDVMLGVAASIPAVLSLRTAFNGDELEAPLLSWGHAILGQGQTNDAGLSWNTSAEMKRNAGDAEWLQSDLAARPNLLGYGHGAGGIGLALLELGTAFGIPAMSKAGLQAFAYEDHWFDDDRQCWPDLRFHDNPDAKGRTEVAWCHGATGIGLARFRAFELTGKPTLLEDARKATRLTRQALATRLTPATNLCLCHGVGSDLELILRARQECCGEDHELINNVHAFIAGDFLDQQRPLPYGGGERHQPPGLMTGLAGTGYTFLRSLEQAPPSLLCPGLGSDVTSTAQQRLAG
ncbi:lanthionine synthetase LanC family protein [Aliiroseovarius crassostreae]|uniref:lanthionine synthetase LanC family protein n=1 Tax=Aliiroseovarius crassostreae TaxID=154981 RepID=UPI00220F0D4C|nr:lanthionine synthetase LanC family protein [Aliiroseovarius crassostreae]UWQ00205.1 hypothetical protein K3X53_15550 [Aliiroseovarius crassostreae]